MRKMRRIMMTVAYDGTAYSGFQIQQNALSIQEVLDKALSKWLGEDIKTMGASRTDAGVHAKGNVIVFDTETQIPAEKYAFGLNVSLPEDIRIQGSREVPPNFHPRFTKTIKTYEYKILQRTFPDPLRRIDSYFYYGYLDVRKMSHSAFQLVGEQDFASFTSAGSEAKTTVRTIYDASVRRDGDLITFRITGNGFLYNMVRIIAGTLMEIGKGNIDEDAMPSIIRKKDRSFAGPTAPACGLTLVNIEFPELKDKW